MDSAVGVVVHDDGGAEAAHEVVVPGRGGARDLVAGRNGELHGVAPHTGRPAPHNDRLARRGGCRGARKLESEVGRVEEAGGGGDQAER